VLRTTKQERERGRPGPTAADDHREHASRLRLDDPLRCVIVSYAVTNVCPDVLAVASRVIGGNDEGSVAACLEELYA